VSLHLPLHGFLFCATIILQSCVEKLTVRTLRTAPHRAAHGCLFCSTITAGCVRVGATCAQPPPRPTHMSIIFMKPCRHLCTVHPCTASSSPWLIRLSGAIRTVL